MKLTIIINQSAKMIGSGKKRSTIRIQREKGMIEIKGHQNVYYISHLGQCIKRRCVVFLVVDELLALDCEFNNDQILKKIMGIRHFK